MEKKVYLATWRGDSRAALAYLEEQNVEIEKLYIDKDESLAEELEAKTGKRGVPYFVVDGEWIKGYDSSGFNPELVRDALGIA
jgi:glutaredoxin